MTESVNRDGAVKAPTIKYRCSYSSVMQDVFRSRGWKEVDAQDTDWHINWCHVHEMREFYDHNFLNERQRISHFRNHWLLTRKNMLMNTMRKLEKTRDKDNSDYRWSKQQISPTTFELPGEYHMFTEEFRRDANSLWIMKPVGKSQGKGIFLIQKLRDLDKWKLKDPQYTPSHLNNDRENSNLPEPYVIQKYISDPYLIGGRKFDLRLYVLVTSYDPLKVWLYREGFARFTTAQFSTRQLNDPRVHLTNVAVQRESELYDSQRGSKWSVMSLRRFLISRHGHSAVDRLMTDISHVVVQPLYNVHTSMLSSRHCFELYGYDVLIDRSLQPWLLEINASPSLVTTGRDDYRLKFDMLDDMLHVVDMEGRLSGREIRVGGFDLLWNDGPVVFYECHGELCRPRPNNFLGCFNNREEQLKSLFSHLE